jgi:hypothetical protein
MPKIKRSESLASRASQWRCHQRSSTLTQGVISFRKALNAEDQAMMLVLVASALEAALSALLQKHLGEGQAHYAVVKQYWFGR